MPPSDRRGSKNYCRYCCCCCCCCRRRRPRPDRDRGVDRGGGGASDGAGSDTGVGSACGVGDCGGGGTGGGDEGGRDDHVGICVVIGFDKGSSRSAGGGNVRTVAHLHVGVGVGVGINGVDLARGQRLRWKLERVESDGDPHGLGQTEHLDRTGIALALTLALAWLRASGRRRRRPAAGPVSIGRCRGCSHG